ncbi:lipid A biosynthesis lauroyl acyltransferase [Arenimonas terrae]|uniref:Lipid A biosynthesis lauroyl acyltransferase n=1 Tax=Arenimonas terrae TaxID=2546226 RepID=A0A5C4RP43_9GAMM|nr:lipid A biosynthesis lauroyl acyltransferase [Arenimonas terrae]TNJ33026.1 lipid A biosynthesis lauroyl acyltransferase [Arenimonas terrae]
MGFPLSSRLMYAAAWCVGRLPLAWAHRLGDAVGALSHRLNTRECKVARRNLELLGHPADAGERDRMLRRILRQTGRNALESLRIWTRPRADNLRLVRSVHGLELLAAAEAAGRGVIVAAPHYGNLELVIEFMAARGPFALVYRTPETEAGDAFLRLARGGENIRLVPAEANAMRPLWKALQAGGAIGITPDQQPKLGGGEFAPFFGRQALTLSLIPRLAERSGATVIFGYAERHEDGHFDLHFDPAPASIASPDLAEATAAMNAGVEAIACRDPSQYQWTYKRWTLRPPGSGETNPYHPDCYRRPRA